MLCFYCVAYRHSNNPVTYTITYFFTSLAICPFDRCEVKFILRRKVKATERKGITMTHCDTNVQARHTLQLWNYFTFQGEDENMERGQDTLQDDSDGVGRISWLY
jgi:hypothetical protein